MSGSAVPIPAEAGRAEIEPREVHLVADEHQVAGAMVQLKAARGIGHHQYLRTQQGGEANREDRVVGAVPCTSGGAPVIEDVAAGRGSNISTACWCPSTGWRERGGGSRAAPPVRPLSEVDSEAGA